MPAVDVPGARIWYEDTASGVPVLLVHGMSGTHEIWRHQLDPLSAGGYRAIRVDRRGAGRSTASRPVVGSSAGDLVAVLDAVDVPRAHLIGHALGASDVLELAVHHRSRVATLTLTNGHGGVADGPVPQWRARTWTPEIMALPASQRELSATYRALQPTGVLEWEAIAGRAQQGDAPATPRRPVRTRDLRALGLPCLVVAGDADLLTPPALLRQLADAVPGSRFEIVADSGHVSHWERPAVWNEVVRDFLDTSGV